MEKIPVLCVAGPTASGKSALAVQLAHRLDGEIVSMDSMQIYRRMDIGTAKPTPEEREGIPHYLLDIVEPTESFSVAEYAQRAETCLREIVGRGKLPILVGGTGFYMRALTDGLHLGSVPSDPELRERLKASATDENGKQALFQQLATVDPDTAARLHPNDVARVSRAVEVYLLTGKPLSQQQNPAQERPFAFCLIGTTLDRPELYRRIDMRVDAMMGRGLLDEVCALLASGIPPEAQAIQGIGYKELAAVVLGRAPLAEAVTLLKQNTRHYAKRQWTWFRAEKRFQWLDMARENSTDQAFRIGEVFWKEAKE